MPSGYAPQPEKRLIGDFDILYRAYQVEPSSPPSQIFESNDCIRK